MPARDRIRRRGLPAPRAAARRLSATTPRGRFPELRPGCATPSTERRPPQHGSRDSRVRSQRNEAPHRRDPDREPHTRGLRPTGRGLRPQWRRPGCGSRAARAPSPTCAFMGDPVGSHSQPRRCVLEVGRRVRQAHPARHSPFAPGSGAPSVLHGWCGPDDRAVSAVAEGRSWTAGE